MQRIECNLRFPDELNREGVVIIENRAAQFFGGANNCYIELIKKDSDKDREYVLVIERK